MALGMPLFDYSEIELSNSAEPALVDDDIAEWAGQFTWSLNNDRAVHFGRVGYVKSRINGEDVFLHQVVLERRGYHAIDGLVADHINRDTLDNRRCNLRAVSVLENARSWRAIGDSG